MTNPYLAPIVTDSPRQEMVPLEEVVRIAKLQRQLNLAVVTNMAVLSFLGESGVGTSIWLRLLIAMAAVVFAIITWIRLATILHGKKWAVAYAVLMAVPILNGIALLALSRRATRRLEEEGIRVGFLGASADEVQAWVKTMQAQCVLCGFEADKTNAIACKHCKRQVHRTCRKEHVAEAHA